jgi:pilus assembly protein Flp/PilA
MLSAVNTWLLKAFARFEEQKGQTMAEYGLILAVIAVVAVGAFILLGEQVDTKVTSITNAFDGSA